MAAGERVLSPRELNRALLARQLLLERSNLPLTRVIEHIGGLQTQYAPSAYIGLWTRMQSFERDRLTRALEQRKVIQGTLIRTTIHMVSARDYPPLVAGVRKSRRDWWLRAHRHDLDARQMAAVANLLRRHLKDGPRRQKELIGFLESKGYSRVAWSGAGLWLDLVRVPPSGTWERRRADLYGLAEDWVGPLDATETDGLELLVRRYLGGFGPARSVDIASWAGLPKPVLPPVLERMRLSRFRDEEGTELFDVPRAPLPNPDTPAPARFLPTWDAMLLVHARRADVLPEAYRPLVFDEKTPHSTPTFIVDGRVAGKWRYEKGRVRLEPFGRLPRAARSELEEEGERLTAFHG
jgi:hypothetical protein